MTKKTFFLTVAALGMTTVLNLAAQGAQRQTASPSTACTDRGDDERRGYCEVRQFTVPAAGLTMSVDAAPNGGISVVGEARADIVVRAEVSARAGTADQARALVARVDVTATADRVSASGPSGSGRDEHWSVSYRLVVPTGTPLSLHTTNGGVSIDNVQSRVEFKTVNGGVSLKRMGGDVQGSTSNGGVSVELDGATWNGGGLDVQTSNGGVSMAVPERYSAHLEAGTRNGSMRVDFPVTVQGEIGRSVSADLGSGGPTLKVRTHNGGVKITRR